jgi:hypothetical protein
MALSMAASHAFAAGGTRIPEGNLTIESGDVIISTIGNGVTFPDGTKQITASNGSGVISVTAASPLNNTGSSLNPIIELTGTIPDSNLATITTPGKVSNSATTATAENTGGSIISRDASGNFSAGTITANLSGNANTATAAATAVTAVTAGNVTGTVAVTNGGTGATTSTAARTNLGVPALASANSFTGTQTIQTGAAATKGLIVLGAANQSANIQEWQDNTGTAVAAITPAGVFTGLIKYGNVAVVAKSGGNYTDPVIAMNNIATWCGLPTATNPCLLKIMPGVYSVASSVVMQPYVDIEGAGENTTKFTTSTVAFTVQGASNAELRTITIENTGYSDSIAIRNISASPSLFKVTAIASGGMGINSGVYNSASSAPTMTNVTTTASGGGPSTNRGIFNTSSSPTMNNTTAMASGGIYNYGIYNTSSSPTMTNMTVVASGGTNNYGVYNTAASLPVITPTMTNVTVTSSGGSANNVGVYNSTASPTMTSVVINASGGTSSTGILSLITGTVKINLSVINGTNSVIGNGPGVTTQVGNSQLAGGTVSNAGTLTCVGAYNTNYVALNTSCQ